MSGERRGLEVGVCQQTLLSISVIVLSNKKKLQEGRIVLPHNANCVPHQLHRETIPVQERER
jgi:hypothetical protein